MSRVEVRAEVAGTVWKVEKRVGDEVKPAEVVMILESMKMEIPVESPSAGVVAEILAAPNVPIDEGDILLVIES